MPPPRGCWPAAGQPFSLHHKSLRGARQAGAGASRDVAWYASGRDAVLHVACVATTLARFPLTVGKTVAPQGSAREARAR